MSREGKLVQELQNFQGNQLVVLRELDECLHQCILRHRLGLAGLVLKALLIVLRKLQQLALFLRNVGLFIHSRVASLKNLFPELGVQV